MSNVCLYAVVCVWPIIHVIFSCFRSCALPFKVLLSTSFSSSALPRSSFTWFAQSLLPEREHLTFAFQANFNCVLFVFLLRKSFPLSLSFTHCPFMLNVFLGRVCNALTFYLCVSARYYWGNCSHFRFFSHFSSLLLVAFASIIHFVSNCWSVALALSSAFSSNLSSSSDFIHYQTPPTTLHFFFSMADIVCVLNNWYRCWFVSIYPAPPSPTHPLAQSSPASIAVDAVVSELLFWLSRLPHLHRCCCLLLLLLRVKGF